MTDSPYPDEQWKTIAMLPDYSVSSHGRIRRDNDSHPNARAGTIRKLVGRRAYLAIGVVIAGQKTTLSVHKLVALAFIGPQPSEAHVVAHGDGDPKNNHVGNLRWATPAENTADRRGHGTALFGERHPIAKLSESDIRAIRSSKDTQINIAKAYGTTQANVSLIRRNEAWKHVR